MNGPAWLQVLGAALEAVALALAVWEIVSRSRLLGSYRAPGVTIQAPVIGRLHATLPSLTVSVSGRVGAPPEQRITALEDAMVSVRDLAKTEADRARDRAEQTARDLASQVEAIAAAELKKVETLLMEVATPDRKAKASVVLLGVGLSLQVAGTILAGLTAT